jgi:cell wall-active antibiotic response 4TMS protein YvqF
MAGTAAPAGYCRHCGKALTTETLREVRGAYYCPDCLATMVGQVQPRPAPGGGRPATAAALGIIPGLGAVFNGEYGKAVIHVLVFGMIISLIDRQPGIFVPALVAWIFYMPFDAYQTAKARAAGKAAGASAVSSSGPSPSAGAQPFARRETIGPILLISIGTLVLLDHLDIVNMDRILDFWPLGLIALGVWMLVKRQEQ